MIWGYLDLRIPHVYNPIYEFMVRISIICQGRFEASEIPVASIKRLT